MKLVREHIDEKFIEKSDPVKDMGIGSFKADEIMFYRSKPGAYGTPQGRSYATLILKYNSPKKLQDYYMKRWPASHIDVKGNDGEYYTIEDILKKGYGTIEFEGLLLDISKKI